MVLLDNNGDPKVFQHEASLFKKGKLMDYETLHAFVTECLIKEYSERKYDAVNTSDQSEGGCDFAIKTASGRTICCKIVLTEESFTEVISKTDFSSLFGYCRKVKGYPRLYTVSAWCFATPDGSKMINGSSFSFKVDSISLLDKEDEPCEQFLSEESLIKTFADAWNNRDVSPLNSILSNHVHYKSSFVFDEIRGKIETLAYLGYLFKRIKTASGKSQLSLCRSRETGELMLADFIKNGLFSFAFQDSRIIDICLKPLERSQVESIHLNESPMDSPVSIQSKIVESPDKKDEKPLTNDVNDSPISEVLPTNELHGNAKQVDNPVEQKNIPTDSTPVIEDRSVEIASIDLTPKKDQETEIRTEKPSIPPPTEEIGVDVIAPTVRVQEHRRSRNKWWIVGLSYLLGFVLSACAVFIFMKGEVEWSKEDITSQIDILKTDKHIACLNDENGSPRYKKEDNVPAGEFYKRHKSFYSTEKTASWYYRVVEQLTPTTFVYSIMSPHGIGFTSQTGTYIDLRFNELKRDIRDDIAKNSIISDNNSYLINSMLNANSRYHSLRRTKDDSKSTEWKFENDSDSYGLYYWEDRWKYDVIQNDDAIKKDSILYTGVVFLITALILTIIFMAIPTFRSRPKD